MKAAEAAHTPVKAAEAAHTPMKAAEAAHTPVKAAEAAWPELSGRWLARGDQSHAERQRSHRCDRRFGNKPTHFTLRKTGAKTRWRKPASCEFPLGAPLTLFSSYFGLNLIETRRAGAQSANSIITQLRAAFFHELTLTKVVSRSSAHQSW
jgi:hypothetical protein